jgi:hypothetical protein
VTVSIVDLIFDTEQNKWTLNMFRKFVGNHGSYGESGAYDLFLLGDEYFAIGITDGYMNMGLSSASITVFMQDHELFNLILEEGNGGAVEKSSDEYAYTTKLMLINRKKPCI